jgi:hypothetical protein
VTALLFFPHAIRSSARRDPIFRKELLCEGADARVTGDLPLTKTIRRDYINGAIGITAFAESARIPPPSLSYVLISRGKPLTSNLVKIVSLLQDLPRKLCNVLGARRRPRVAWYTDPQFAYNGRKAFIVTRIGDAGFVLGIRRWFGGSPSTACGRLISLRFAITSALSDRRWRP